MPGRVRPISLAHAPVAGDFPAAVALALPPDQTRAAWAAAGAEHRDLAALAGQDEIVPAVAGKGLAFVICAAKALALGRRWAFAAIAHHSASFADHAGLLAAEGLDRDSLPDMAGGADALPVANSAAMA